MAFSYTVVGADAANASHVIIETAGRTLSVLKGTEQHVADEVAAALGLVPAEPETPARAEASVDDQLTPFPEDVAVVPVADVVAATAPEPEAPAAG